jgi:hypothetical protein
MNGVYGMINREIRIRIDDSMLTNKKIPAGCIDLNVSFYGAHVGDYFAFL